MQLVRQLESARQSVDQAERRVAGLRKLIEAVVEIYPAAEDELPDDLDDEREPRPRGAEAVRRVLADRAGNWYRLPVIVDMLDEQGWLPASGNPTNAVRSAAERLIATRVLEKERAEGDGAVIYRYPKPPADPPPGYDDEEPF